MKSLEIRPDPYFENAARQLVELNKELAGNLSPGEAHMAETKQFDRVCVIEPCRSTVFRKTPRSQREQFYSCYVRNGAEINIECSSLFNAQQISRREGGTVKIRYSRWVE